MEGMRRRLNSSDFIRWLREEVICAKEGSELNLESDVKWLKGEETINRTKLLHCLVSGRQWWETPDNKWKGK